MHVAEVVRHERAARRIRVRIDGLHHNASLARKVEADLRAEPGVTSVQASLKTGRVLLGYSNERPLVGIARTETGDFTALPAENPPIAAANPAPVAGGQALPVRSASRSNWHALHEDSVFDALESGAQGLSAAEALRRLRQYGKNEFEALVTRSNGQILADQLKSLPSGLLLGSSALSFLMGDIADALAIGSVVALNAGIGYRIEQKNEQYLAAWRKLEAGDVRVLRDGELAILPNGALVPGDIVLLRRGDIVPADGRVVDAHRLACDESSLTGESEPNVKSTAATDSNAPLSDRHSMVYYGMPVVAGHGRFVVTATGRETELANIRKLIDERQGEATVLEQKLDSLGRRMTVAGLAAAAGSALPAILRRAPPLQVARGAVALAVAAIPEGLPVVATATLVRSVKRLRDRGMVVRRLSAAETLGGVTVVCVDKTGTLTRNEMTVEQLEVASRDGNGRSPDTGLPTELSEARRWMLAAAVLNSDLDFQENGSQGTEVVGSSTERAMFTAAENAGLDPQTLRAQFPRRLLKERHEGVNYVVSVHDDVTREGQHVVLLKGAPEQVLSLCRADLDGPLDESRRTGYAERNRAMAEDGLRVLAIGSKREAKARGSAEAAGFTLLGLIAMRDPVRHGAAEAIHAARQAGIRAIILTGDQLATAKAVSRQLHLQGEAIDGPQLASALGDEEDARFRLRNVAVVSRVTPEDKVNIVHALRRSGEVVAMAGDGVNDAPALKAADIGIAVGKHASDLARQTAGVVLENADLRSILTAVGEGRIVQDNLRRSIRFLLATNASEALLVMGGALLGRVPLAPIQLLWLNLLTDTLPALAVALEPGEPGVLDRAPAPPGAPILSRGAWRSVVRDGLLLAAGGGGAYLVGSGATGFASLAGGQLGYAFLCRAPGPASRANFTRLMGASLALQAAGMLVPPLPRILQLGQVSLSALSAFAGGVFVPALLERLRPAPLNSFYLGAGAL